MSSDQTALSTGLEVRRAARSGTCSLPTSGLAPSYLQANLIILPSRFATDFRLLCARNPVPCPLVAESIATGRWDAVKSHIPGLEGISVLSDCDIRLDAPRYMVYRDSKLTRTGCLDIQDEWTEDHVAFLIGCSFSFESALADAGLVPRHIALKRNVSMYRTTLPLCPAGVFTGGTYVVSMRPYKGSEITRVRDITRGYSATHGEPIAWGWDAVRMLGIANIDVPEWGDAPLASDGTPMGGFEGSEEDVPVFWGCGVTPQEAVVRAGLPGVVMSHAPGHMLLLDCKDTSIVRH
jgi:uncharacterized protein YcsI (UPF0317 family)